MEKWKTEDIPMLRGRLALITGGTSGIGLEIAKELVRAHAEVVITGEDLEKGQEALDIIREEVPAARISFNFLDLSDLGQVKDFSKQFLNEYSHLDILVNNAGVAGIPDHVLSVDGFELTFAINYLGHFALTAKLYPLLLDTPGARIVCQSSLEHRGAELDFENFNAEKYYDPAGVYAQSKLALLIFSLELARRIEQHGLAIMSIPVHSGAVRTDIFHHPRNFKNVLMNLFIKTFGQSPAKGALPALFAATSLFAHNGNYYGPGGAHELRGYPARARITPQASSNILGEKLWLESEKYTGVKFDLRVGGDRKKYLFGTDFQTPLWL
jgi:NAD(P)-dependent dehydrogenase (short-subunit alcohol dehydrogenase family)